MILLLLMIGLALGAPSDDQGVRLQRGGCPPFWFSFKGRCYKYVASRLTWGAAELHCVSQGANLVSIHSVDEHNFVNSLIRNFDHTQSFTWIGLTDAHKEGGWMWSDGSKVSFVFWNSHQPDNAGGREHCGHTNFDKYKKWNDHQCSQTFASVCASRRICA